MAGYIPPQPPDYSFQGASNLSLAWNNCTQLIVLVQQIIAMQSQGQAATQEQVNQVVNLQQQGGVLIPRPNYTLDGVTYSWGDYLASLTTAADVLRKSYISASGPFLVVSRGRCR